jgi:GxxExxY protein
MEIVYKDESYAVVGACFAVYNEMGFGFTELSDRGIPFKPQAELPLMYKGRRLQKVFVPDFVCYDKIIVEIKAVREFGDEHRAQLHNYLKATGYKLGLLINFGHHGEVLYERIVK